MKQFQQKMENEVKDARADSLNLKNQLSESNSKLVAKENEVVLLNSQIEKMEENINKLKKVNSFMVTH